MSGQLAVFLAQRDFSNRARVGADPEANPSSAEGLDRVVRIFVTNTGLYVAGRANLQVNRRRTQMLQQGSIFRAANAMTDPRWLKRSQGLPHAVRAACLACVRCPAKASLDRIPVGHYVSIDGKSRLVTRQVKRRHQAAAELIHQACGLQTLLLGEVPQRTKDKSRFNSRRPDAIGGGAFNSRHHLGWREPAGKVQQGRKANLRIDNMVGLELLKDVLDDHTQSRLGLHQLKAARSPGEKVR